MRINPQTFKTLLDPHESFDWLSMWPKVKTLYWITPPEHLQFLKHFLTLDVRFLKINFERAEDEEFQEILGLVESRCMNLEDLRLFDSETRENKEIQDTIRQIIYNNSLTLRLFYPPQDPSAPLVNDILQLPALQVLEMHIPQIPDPAPWDILPALEYLSFTVDDALDIIGLLGNLSESKLRQFTLTCPYPTSEDDQATLGEFFEDSGLYDSVQEFSWVSPSSDEGPPTWEFVTTLSSFINMQELCLDVPCWPVCRFNFRHHHVVELSRWMPQLKELNFGGSPCALGGLTTDIGYHTLDVLAKNCPNLILLVIHFNINTFVPVRPTEPNWNVKMWEVGDTPLPNDPQSLTMIALAVSMIFPRVALIGTTEKHNMKWNVVREELSMLTLPAAHGKLDLM